MPFLPKLDPKPSGRPQDWSLRKIQQLTKPEIIEIPESWTNPFAKQTAPRDQSFRGTCVGQSTAYCYDMRYMELTGDLPTEEDKKRYKKDVTDVLGTIHDILYPQSASAEQFYSVSRTIGNVDYPAGSETRFAARAWNGYGMNTEDQWHTDKPGKMCWAEFPRKTSDGGLSKEEAAVWAAAHKAEGWAMVGDENGNATYEEVCQAIYKYKFVLAGIPVYANYDSMANGDGSFPEPRGEIVGYHALAFYGYDSQKLKLIHSWGDWCGRFGSISKEYFNNSRYESVYLVILDSKDVKIARGHYHALDIKVQDSTTKTPILADITVNGVLIGKAPQKITVEPGQEYKIEASMTGYFLASKTQVANDVDEEILLSADALPETPKNWFQVVIQILQDLWRKLRNG
jgi:hypothetical protein